MQQIVLGQIIFQCIGGPSQVVVRDLGEEEMVHQMAIRNMVVQQVDPRPVLAIHGFECRVCVIPGGVVIHFRIWLVVVQEGHGPQEPFFHFVNLVFFLAAHSPVLNVMYKSFFFKLNVFSETVLIWLL